MKIKKLQICVIVRDLDAAIERYQSLFGIGPFAVYKVDTRELPGITYRGQPGNYRLRVGMANLGGGILELLEPQGGDSPFEDFLKQHGEGVQHVGLVVEDYARISVLKLQS